MTRGSSVIVFANTLLSRIRAALNLGGSLLTLDHTHCVTWYLIRDPLNIRLLFLRIQILQRKRKLLLWVILIINARSSAGIDLLDFGGRQLFDLYLYNWCLFRMFIWMYYWFYLRQVPRRPQLNAIKISLLFALFNLIVLVFQRTQNHMWPLLLNVLFLARVEIHLGYTFLLTLLKRLRIVLLIFFLNHTHARLLRYLRHRLGLVLLWSLRDSRLLRVFICLVHPGLDGELRLSLIPATQLGR